MSGPTPSSRRPTSASTSRSSARPSASSPTGVPWIQTVARRGYRFLGAVRAQAAAPRSLAVLPFRSLGTDEADEALGLGMADALITRLAATGRVAVRPTGTVRRFASADVDPVEAGRQLGVDAVVDGRLQRSGSRLRLTVQLVPTAGGAPLWADQFDEEFTHLFAVEDTVAERVAAALVAELSAEERQRLGRRQTESLEAYQAYCRGRFFWGRFSRPWVEKAMLSFHEATAHDPRYALPHAGLADAFLVAGFAGALPPREAWALAAESSRAALGLDDRIPEPHVSAGFLRLLQEWDWNGAERELRRALELAPDSAAPHQWLGLVLDLRGRKDDAARALRRAEELDPLSLVVSALVGLHHAFGGEHEAELAQARRTLELDPHQFLGHWAVGSALQNLGRHDEAAAEHQRGARPGRGHRFHEARSRAQPGPRRPGGRGAGASGPGGAGRSLTLPGGDRPPRAGRDGPRARAPGGGGRAARPLDRDPRRRPDDEGAAGPSAPRCARPPRRRRPGSVNAEGQPRHPSKVLFVARHDHAAVLKREGGDPQVVISDRASRCPEGS